MVTFRSRLWRWDEVCRASVFAVLLFVFLRWQGALGVTAPSTAVAAIVVIVVVPLLFLPDVKTLSISQDQVSLQRRGLVRRKPRESEAPRGAVSSLRIRARGGALCDEAGRRLSLGSGWTREQYRTMAVRLGIPLYDHRLACGLGQRRTGRLIYEPGADAAIIHP